MREVAKFLIILGVGLMIGKTIGDADGTFLTINIKKDS